MSSRTSREKKGEKEAGEGDLGNKSGKRRKRDNG